MPRAEAGSAKAVANAQKARGLTKLPFYCSLCDKACRDANGFKMHTMSESHLRRAGSIDVHKATEDNSREFQRVFVDLLSRRFGTARMDANKVYQEIIKERHHKHMNSTKWVTLTQFVKHLGREGICHVEEIPDEGGSGWYISWIDNSPEALARQDALQKMQRAKKGEEDRMRQYLKEQIERAEEQERRQQATSGSSEGKRPLAEEQGLQADSARAPLKIGISLAPKPDAKAPEVKSSAESKAEAGKPGDVLPPQPAPSGGATTATTPAAAAPFKIAMNPLRASKPLPSPFSSASRSSSSKPSAEANPLKKPKAAGSAPVSASSSRTSSMTAAERIMMEEQERKRKMSGPQPAAHIKRSRF